MTDKLTMFPTYYFLTQLGPDGMELWWKELNVGEYDVSTSVVETTDGGFLVGGASLLSEGIHWSIFIDKTDSEGNLEWRKIYDNENSQVALAAHETRDGGYIIVGYRSSQTDGSNDVLLMKTDAEGNL
ncbi:MAG: hypothetical protein ACE5EE_05915 [Fidelibacterota bacterium]